MTNKGSICRNCFHSYVCEQFNENKDDNNEKCHFFNDHYVPTADVVPKSEVEELSGKYEDLKLKYADLQKDKDELIAWGDDKKTEVAREIFEEIERVTAAAYNYFMFDHEGVGMNATLVVEFSDEIDREIAELKKKYTEGEQRND